MSNGFINVKHWFYDEEFFLRSEKLKRILCIVVFFIQDVLLGRRRNLGNPLAGRYSGH